MNLCDECNFRDGGAITETAPTGDVREYCLVCASDLGLLDDEPELKAQVQDNRAALLDPGMKCDACAGLFARDALRPFEGLRYCPHCSLKVERRLAEWQGAA